MISRPDKRQITEKEMTQAKFLLEKVEKIFWRGFDILTGNQSERKGREDILERF
jgi:hypothetical protein